MTTFPLHAARQSHRRSSGGLHAWFRFVVGVAFSIATLSKIVAAPFFQPGDIVAAIGGEDMVESQRYGYLELLAATCEVTPTPRFRDLAWEGDTVYDQPRELNFPSWPEQLKSAGVTALLIQFGQAESLKGGEASSAFLTAYEKFLAQLPADGKRVVLLSPTPFENPGGNLPDLSRRNGDLSVYVAVIQQLAQRRGCTFVDLFHPLQEAGRTGQKLTRDGLHLNARGHWLAAQRIVTELCGATGKKWPQLAGDDGKLGAPEWEQLRRLIAAKNQYWFEYRRPENWAFLNGDRTEQPSSRDHRDPKIRWFPREMQEFLPLISSREGEISSLAAKLKP